MSSPSRDHLLGYLLQALSPDEHDQVEAELDRTSALRDEMRRLEANLSRVGLGDERPYFDPPAGLAERTCDVVAGHAAQPVVSPAVALAYQPAEPRRRFTAYDFVALAGVVALAAALIFPAVYFSRLQAKVYACQDQLRLIGLGLHSFSDLQPDHSFPGPEPEGNRAAAGIVAPLLVSYQLADSRAFVCPSSPLSRETGGFRVPLPEEVDQAVGQQLKTMIRTMGGDYGYGMGYIAGDKLLKTCNSRRQNYALVADAPSNSQPRRASGNHRGQGQNVYFEDGHIHFLKQVPGGQLDDPYHNRNGWVEAGVDRDDAVLGASADPPLLPGFIHDSR